ncbi:unnamed protein product [Onchocerca ochengi]|uniref:Phlebovirus_G2 domain-containing protein n=1 Tax=Onchocerca ochengi TaxID=42157 RepID=A0A182EPU9_ONCOC|nr:unnamed protein product [Onchocerca ochengi]
MITIAILLTSLWKQIICGTLTNEVHCTRIIPIQGNASNMDESGKRIQEISTTVADLTLKETLCLNFTKKCDCPKNEVRSDSEVQIDRLTLGLV